jgi:glutathione S-transferase
MSKVPTLGYYDTRGLAQPIRLLLKYAGVEFNDKRYEFGPGSTLAEIESIRKYWLTDKSNLGLDFPNLPYYIDRDVKVSYHFIVSINNDFY